MPSIKLSILLKGDNKHFDLKEDPAITGLCYDSRKAQKGDLFFAVKGANSDGHDYLNDVHGKGVVAAMVSTATPAKITQIETSDIFKSMANVAQVFYDNPSRKIPIIGVTGTNGKTTITYIIETILKLAQKKCGVMGTISNRLGDEVQPSLNTTPLSLDIYAFIDHLNQNHADALIMEVSSHALALERVEGITYHTAIFTNLTQDHLDFHKTMEEYFNVKARLFRNAPKPNSIINIDDAYGRRLDEELAPFLTYGFSEDAQLRAEDPHYSLEGSEFLLSFPSGAKHRIKTNLLGRHNILNLLGAAGALISLGFSEFDVVKGLMLIHTIPGRLEQIRSKKGYVVVVDYAHTPDALVKILISLNELKPNKIISVFGAGGDRDRTKRPLMAKAAAKYSNQIVVTSDNPRTEDPLKIIKDIEEGFKEIGYENYFVDEHRESAIGKALSLAGKNDVVLIAGKGHEDYQIYGKTKQHFSDRESVLKVLSNES